MLASLKVMLPQGTKVMNDQFGLSVTESSKIVTVQNVSRNKNTGETVVSWRGHRGMNSATLPAKSMASTS